MKSNKWLMKTEPNEYSIDDLKSERDTLGRNSQLSSPYL